MAGGLASPRPGIPSSWTGAVEESSIACMEGWLMHVVVGLRQGAGGIRTSWDPPAPLHPCLLPLMVIHWRV